MVLSRLGRYGNGDSARDLAFKFGVADGTVNLYHGRVCKAILQLAPRFISWPSKDERVIISNSMELKYKFKGCIASVDGTNIKLIQRPHLDGQTYFDRKMRYSINVQAAIDINKNWRYVQV